MENEAVVEEKEIIKSYPIAEMFESVQGEGHHVGTPFAFIRMAGCTVGKPDAARIGALGLPPYHEVCTTFEGREFICDTNFRMHHALPIADILEWVSSLNIEHVCFTGGEPLMHDIKPLVDAFRRLTYRVHIETSGTIAPGWLLSKGYESVWVAVSPKKGYLANMIYRANEVKILVGEDFDQKKISAPILTKNDVFLQPIDDVLIYGKNDGQNKLNVDKCLEILKTHPRWRLSIQMHKVIGVR